MGDATIGFLFEQNMPEVEDDRFAGLDEDPFIAIFGIGPSARGTALATRPVGYIETGFADKVMNKTLCLGTDILDLRDAPKRSMYRLTCRGTPGEDDCTMTYPCQTVPMDKSEPAPLLQRNFAPDLPHFGKRFAAHGATGVLIFRIDVQDKTHDGHVIIGGTIIEGKETFPTGHVKDCRGEQLSLFVTESQYMRLSNAPLD